METRLIAALVAVVTLSAAMGCSPDPPEREDSSSQLESSSQSHSGEDLESAEPIAAIVLGEEVRTSDAGEMQAVILTRLFDRYAQEQAIEVSEAEIEGYLEHLDEVRSEDFAERRARLVELDRRLGSESLSAADRQSLEEKRTQEAEQLASLEADQDLTPEDAAEVHSLRRGMAQSAIRQWKLNRSLHREYGGRVIYQQGGPEPLDAYRAFLEERRDSGAFEIQNQDFEPEFWRYFTDESIHDFYEPGSESEALVEHPPWQG